MLKAMQDWVVQNGPKYAIMFITFILILIIGKIVIDIVCKLLEKALRKAEKVSEILEEFTVNVTKKCLYILLFVIALSNLGINVTPLITGLGVGGFIVGFAFQETLGNLAAGLMILLNEPFKKGDYIEAGGSAGVVQNLSVMATTLTSPDNKKITIPNSKVWGASIINYSALETRRVDLGMGISYGADINKAREVALAVCEKIEPVLSEPAPTVEVVEMADSSVNFVVRPWCKNADYWSVYFQVNQGIKEGLDKAGIEIPFPQVDVHQK